MMISGLLMGRRGPGHRKVGRILTTNRQGSFIGEEGRQRGRAGQGRMGSKEGRIARSRMRKPVGNSERIMVRPMVHTKVEPGIRQASTTGLGVKLRVAIIESHNRNRLEEANSIRAKIQMLRNRDLESMGSLEKNLIFQDLLHGEVS
jgi:hypothetical protein